MVRRVAVLVIALLVCLGSTAGADAIDDFVKAKLEENRTPGLSLVVVDHGKIVKVAGYGFADREARIPVTPDTVFKIGSVSKQFLASGIMLLVRQGRVQLDESIESFFEDLPAAWKPITVRQLLTHTSGLLRESPAFDPLSDKSDADVIRGAYASPLHFTPGARWEYSNVGYYILAEIIHKTSGQSWSEFIDAAIFRPSGMTTTLPTNTTRAVSPLAVGYTGKDNGSRAPHWVALRPSGAFLSTVLDLAKWEAMLYTEQVLTAAERTIMWTPVRLNDKSGAPYGFGWNVDRAGAQRRIWHGGGLPGFVSHYVRFPEEGVTVIALTNGEDTDIRGIANGAASLYSEYSRSASSAKR